MSFHWWSGLAGGALGALAILAARHAFLPGRPGFAHRVAARMSGRPATEVPLLAAGLLTVYGVAGGLLFALVMIELVALRVVGAVYPWQLLLFGLAWGVVLWLVSLDWTWLVAPPAEAGPGRPLERSRVVVESFLVHMVYGAALGIVALVAFGLQGAAAGAPMGP